MSYKKILTTVSWSYHEDCTITDECDYSTQITDEIKEQMRSELVGILSEYVKSKVLSGFDVKVEEQYR